MWCILYILYTYLSIYYRYFHGFLIFLEVFCVFLFFLCFSRIFLSTVERHNIYTYMGVSLNGGTPQNTPKCSFLVGKPIVVGYHHFMKLPYECVNFSVHYSVFPGKFWKLCRIGQMSHDVMASRIRFALSPWSQSPDTYGVFPKIGVPQNGWFISE